MILFKLFVHFFIIGCFSFGGGYAMLPHIESQVYNQEWMTSEQFSDVVVISSMLPGSIGTNAAAFVGFQTAGFTGAIIATIGIVFPSILLTIFIVRFLKRFQERPFIDQIFYALRPVIVGLILYSAIKFGMSIEIVQALSWKSISFVLLALISFFILNIKNKHPIFVVIFTGVFGIILYH